MHTNGMSKNLVAGQQSVYSPTVFVMAMVQKCECGQRRRRCARRTTLDQTTGSWRSRCMSVVVVQRQGGLTSEKTVCRDVSRGKTCRPSDVLRLDTGLDGYHDSTGRMNDGDDRGRLALAHRAHSAANVRDPPVPVTFSWRARTAHPWTDTPICHVM